MKQSITMPNLEKYPALIPACAFILGILLQGYITNKPLVYIAILSFAFLANVLLDSLAPLLYGKLRLQSIALIFVFISLGAIRVLSDKPMYQKGHISHLVERLPKSFELEGIVTEMKKNDRTIKVSLTVNAFTHNGNRIEKEAKTILYFKNVPTSLKIFDKIKANVDLLPISKANPYAFDYAQYLRRKDIYFTAYVSKLEKVSIIGTNIITWQNWPLYIRSKLDNRLQVLISNSKVYSLTSAMLLGERGAIDKEVLEVFSATGAIHILAVSGLHVGILFQLIYLLFGFLGIKEKWRMIFAIVLSMCYAIMVGASPSVIRATILISMVFIGISMKKYVNVFNLLSIVAITMLFIHPQDIYSISFQFSFTAILSLALFARPIYGLVSFQNVGIQLVWKMLSTTIGAQILMTPLVVYYFHQFPTYFFLSCFVAIPLAYVAVVGGLMVLFLGLIFTFLTQIFSQIFVKVVLAFYFLLDKIYNLPGAKIEGLFLSLPMLYLITMSVMIAYLYLHTQKRKYLWMMNVLLVLLVFEEWTYKAKISADLTVQVYDVRKGILIDVFDGMQRFTYKTVEVSSEDESFASNSLRIARYAMQNGHDMFKDVESDSNQSCRLFDVGMKKLCLFNDNDAQYLFKSDIIIVGSKAALEKGISLENKTIVFANKVKLIQKKAFEIACNKCIFHDMDDKGYFSISLPRN